MAAVSVPAPLSHFKQEAELEEEEEEERDQTELEEEEEERDQERDQAELDEEQAGAEDGKEQTKPTKSPAGKFKLGLDSGSELLDELTFSLEHCAEGGAGQPPPGHWVSQPHGKLLPHLTPRVLIHSRFKHSVITH